MTNLRKVRYDYGDHAKPKRLLPDYSKQQIEQFISKGKGDDVAMERAKLALRQRDPTSPDFVRG